MDLGFESREAKKYEDGICGPTGVIYNVFRAWDGLFLLGKAAGACS